MAISSGTSVCIKKIIKSNSTLSEYFDALFNKIDKVGVITGTLLDRDSVLLYNILFLKNKTFQFYREEFEIIGRDNIVFLGFCCEKEQFNKYTVFKNQRIYYCPKCLR